MEAYGEEFPNRQIKTRYSTDKPPGRHSSIYSVFDFETIGDQSSRRQLAPGAPVMTGAVKTVVRDAAIVYGFTFAAGLGMALAGATLQNSPSTAYMTNLLSGALGFTVAGLRTLSNRTEHLAWVAATVGAFNLINIALGIQSSTSWIHSSLTVILMAALGGTLAFILTLAPSPDRRT